MRGRIRLAALLLLALATPARSQPTVGLFVNDSPDAGYTLFSPIGTVNSHLINNDGLLVRSWTGSERPGLMAYLTVDGTLLRSSKIPGGTGGFPTAAGYGGRFEEYDWDGSLIWEYDYASATHYAHHDFERMPDGNLLILAWDLMTQAEAIAAGKDPGNLGNELLVDSVIEIQPTPPLGATIVWEWHARDHLIQDFDPTKDNFGVLADHPELIDFNFGGRRDLIHVNAVDYNAALDQIVLSASRYDEVWVIDHGTTTAEAAGHSGGSRGKGGDLIYRWGNPQTYDRGELTERVLFGQHDVQWIDPGLPGAGNLLLFNNNQAAPEGSYSTVDELTPAVDGNGDYPLADGQAYGPADFVWTFVATPPESFYSPGTSGATRLPNGNTLATVGQDGRLVEIEPSGTITWEYQNPDTGGGLVTQGNTPGNSGVFKARRYPPDFPGFAGKDLTPGDPLEGFTRPAPPATGTLRADRLDAGGTQIEVVWSDGGCPSFQYHLLFGDLADVASTSVGGAACNVGPSGPALWSAVPPGDLFFVIVGTDLTGVYESGWGASSDATLRGATKASFRCGTTTKVLDPQCP